MSNTFSPEVDQYIERLSQPFGQILSHIRSVAHESCPGLEESMKWAMPCLSQEGIVAQLAGFKNHARLGFWKGSLLESPHLQLMGESAAMGMIRIDSPADVPEDAVLVDLFRRAVDLNQRGIRIPKKRREPAPALEPPEWLLKALRINPEAWSNFQSMAPSHQREYVEWLVDAKQEATRLRRLDQAVEWLADGKPRNWKYMDR